MDLMAEWCRWAYQQGVIERMHGWIDKMRSYKGKIKGCYGKND
jgi:hypothetical protein